MLHMGGMETYEVKGSPLTPNDEQLFLGGSATTESEKVIPCMRQVLESQQQYSSWAVHLTKETVNYNSTTLRL